MPHVSASIVPVCRNLAYTTVATLVGFCLFTGIAQAQTADPEWFGELRKQLEVSEKCMAEAITDPKEAGEGAELVQEATASCEDGRTIMASRAGTNSQFSFVIKE